MVRTTSSMGVCVRTVPNFASKGIRLLAFCQELKSQLERMREELDRLIKKLDVGLGHSRMEVARTWAWATLGLVLLASLCQNVAQSWHSVSRSKTRYNGEPIKRVEFFKPGPTQSQIHLEDENVGWVLRHSDFGFEYNCELSFKFPLYSAVCLS